MGTKEDGLSARWVYGYAAQLRPMQTDGGPCTLCGETVWIDVPKDDGKKYLGIVPIHYSCDAR